MRANFEKVLKTTWKWEKIESRILYASFSRTFLWQFAGEYYLYLNKTFLEAQLLYNYIDVTDKTHSLTGRLAILNISPLIVDQFGRFCQLEFDNSKSIEFPG